MSEQHNAIISIKPHFAQAIFEGEKTVELRRRIPMIEVGTRLWVYATRPTAAIIGYVTLERLVSKKVEDLWRACGKKANVDKKTFDSYFNDVKEGFGLFISDVKRIKPIQISKLREIRDGFHPPQVTLRLTSEEAEMLFQLS